MTKRTADVELSSSAKRSYVLQVDYVVRNQSQTYSYFDIVPTEIVHWIGLCVYNRPRFMDPSLRHVCVMDTLKYVNNSNWNQIDISTQTHDLCLHMVKRCVSYLDEVQHKTQAIYEASVLAWPHHFWCVPQRYQTQTMLSALLNSNPSRGSLSQIRRDLWSPELCDYFLRKDGNNIKDIDRPTLEQTYTAVKTNPRSYRHLQDPSEEVTLYALHKNVGTMDYVKNASVNVWKMALLKSPSRWVRVAPAEALTPDICFAMVEKDPKVYNMFWTEQQTPGVERLYRALTSDLFV